MIQRLRITFALLLGFAAIAPSALAADSASVQALLITASKGGGGSDPALAPYEATLKRTLPFDTFRLAGQGSASVSGNGRATISLPGGHRVELSGGDRGGGGIKVNVEWKKGGEVVMATALTLRPGVPAVLGRGGDGDVPVVLLVAR
jgi:hypothetical protein